MCRHAVSVSDYCAWRGRPPSERVVRDTSLLKKIQREHTASRETSGSPRVHAALKREGERVGRRQQTSPLFTHCVGHIERMAGHITFWTPAYLQTCQSVSMEENQQALSQALAIIKVIARASSASRAEVVVAAQHLRLLIKPSRRKAILDMTAWLAIQ
jgi:hypothetical protein